MLLTVIFPVLILMLVGYVSVRIEVLNQEQIKSLGTFVMKVSLPAFMLHALSTKTIEELWLPEYLFIYILSSGLLFIMAYLIYTKIFKYRFSSVLIISLGASVSNTGLLGTALIPMLIGKDIINYLALTILFESVVITCLMLALTDPGLYQKTTFPDISLKVLKQLIRNPIVVAILLAIGCIIFDITLPVMVDEPLELLGQAAAPIAFVVIGASLSRVRWTYVDMPSILLVCLKVIALPSIVFIFLMLFPHVEADLMYVGVLIALLPMPTLFSVLGQIYGLEQKASNVLTLSTGLSLILMSIVTVVWWS